MAARRRLQTQAAESSDLVSWAIGLDLLPRALDLLDRELGAAWTMRWQPADYEIGHRGGLRLRQAARLSARRR